MSTTDQKGAIAETAIAHEATRLGIEVYRPIAEGGRFDMIFLLGDDLTRVQCKWAPRQGDVIVVRCYSNRRAKEGLDAVCTQLMKSMICCLLPRGRPVLLHSVRRIPARSQILLRLGPTQNSQRELVNWASDYEFAARLAGHHGAIAQLGERRHGMAEVVGSSPTGSTLFPLPDRQR